MKRGCFEPRQGRKNVAQGASPGNSGRKHSGAPEGAKETHCRSLFSFAPPGLGRFWTVFPGLTSWARFFRPSGARPFMNNPG